MEQEPRGQRTENTELTECYYNSRPKNKAEMDEQNTNIDLGQESAQCSNISRRKLPSELEIERLQ